jgi:hypothetical protein
VQFAGLFIWILAGLVNDLLRLDHPFLLNDITVVSDSRAGTSVCGPPWAACWLAEPFAWTGTVGGNHEASAALIGGAAVATASAAVLAACPFLGA